MFFPLDSTAFVLLLFCSRYAVCQWSQGGIKNVFSWNKLSVKCTQTNIFKYIKKLKERAERGRFREKVTLAKYWGLNKNEIFVKLSAYFELKASERQTLLS